MLGLFSIYPYVEYVAFQAGIAWSLLKSIVHKLHRVQQALIIAAWFPQKLSTTQGHIVKLLKLYIPVGKVVSLVIVQSQSAQFQK